MAPLPLKVLKRGKLVWLVDLRSIRRGRRFFPTEAQARVYRAAIVREHDNFGASAHVLSHQDRVEFLAAQDKLKGSGGSITQAVEHFLRHKASVAPKTAREAFTEFLASKEASGKRKRYTVQLRYSVGAFIEGCDGRVDEITAANVQTWLAAGGWSLLTRKGYLRDVCGFFNWCVKRRHCSSNPCHQIERIIVDGRPVEILTVEQSRSLMHACLETDGPLVPALTLALFCGIRPQEIQRLSWSDVDIKGRFVLIGSSTSKTRRRRLVTISDGARQFLALGGDIPPKDYVARLLAVRKAAGITRWPHNALRHSFCSYHLAMHQRAAETALQAGHSEQMLFQHYRSVVTLASAVKFWGIGPL